jgi:uncharacterized protein
MSAPMSASRSLLGRTIVIATVAIAALVVVGPGLTPWRPAGQAKAAPTLTDPVRGITVQGTGKVTISPDLATINVSVQLQAATAAEAQSKANTAMTKVIAAVKGKGIADADLATQWISLAPQYSYDSNGTTLPKVVGYQASQSLTIKVRKIDDAGPVIDAAVGAGANQVDGIAFSVADPTNAAAQARTAAVADARTRAASLASAAGVTLGGAVSMTEVSATAPVPIPFAYDKALGSVAPQTPVQAGTTEIEVDVQVTFAIGS